MPDATTPWPEDHGSEDHGSEDPGASPRRMHCYYAYGLVIHSQFALPELQHHEAGVPDLVFRRANISGPSVPEGEGIYEFGDLQAYIAVGGVGRFSIRAGLVEYAIEKLANPSLISLVMLGSVLATVLLFRGFLTLHASGVEVGGRGVVFLGDKGAGKSSTAAAFLRAGHRLLTDDVMPVDITEQAARILPGFPQVKLSTEAAAAFNLPDVVSQHLASLDFVKTRLRLADGFMSSPVPARCFYILARGQDLSIDPLEALPALGALMRNTYHARFGTQLFQGAVAARQMRLCAALAGLAPVKLLTIPRGLDLLDNIVALIERDVR